MIKMRTKRSPIIKVPEKITNTNSDKHSDGEKSKSSKSGKSRKNNKAESITKLPNYQIKKKKTFTTLNTRIEDMDNEDFDLTNSDDYGKERSHLLFKETYCFKGVPQTIGVLPSKSFILIKPLKKDQRVFFQIIIITKRLG